jgi:glycine/D-amino acid oxidase-like deaminating enzyme
MKAIVVGGGIMGATTAWELARAGVEVTLFEAGSLAQESTGKSAAIVRMHYSNPEVVRMAVYSREQYRRLPLLLGCDPVYTRCGWLFLVEQEEADVALENAQMQEGEGVDLLEVDDLQEYVPGIDESGIAYALFENESGYADPIAATNAYAESARQHGAQIEQHAPVEALVAEAERVRGVHVDGVLHEADHVVLAAGAWSAQLAAGIGLELPVEIYREQDVIFDVAPEQTIRHAISSQVDRVYMRPAPEHGPASLLAGRGFPKEYELVDPDGYDDSVDDDFEEDVHARVARRIPRLSEMTPADGRAGLYTVTPDWHPLLGYVPGYEGLSLATAGSGHSFKLGPAIGALVAGELTGTPVEFADIATLSLARFDEGRELRSTYGGNRA